MSRRRKKRRPSYTVHNKVKLVKGGREFFSLLVQMIDDAKSSVHFQTYIFDADETGRSVADALMRAARRGVHVYMLIDGYASQHLPVQFIQELTDAGVNFSFFKPLFKSHGFYFGRRLHHKVIVTDAAKGMAGGINTSNRYNDIAEIKAWMDWAFYVEGDAAGKLFRRCADVWNKSIRRERCYEEEIQPSHIHEECLVRIRSNDWINRHTQITRSYQEMFAHAQSSIIIMTSYFWPSQKLLRRMAAAAKRGVNIKLILAGDSDIKISKYAERFLYRRLFRNNIEIYEYTANVLHGKLAVYDKEWATVGSYNVNNISAYASIELNIDVKNNAVAQTVHHRLSQVIQENCIHITEKDYLKKTNLMQRIMYRLAYRIVHLIFFLFTFYFRQTKV